MPRTTLPDLVAWLNATYPTRNWDQWCAKLVWNTVWFVSGLEEREVRTYDPAKAAYRASQIESTDALAAPPGAIHYLANPVVDGHVAVELGNGLVLMTGTLEALGDGGVLVGNNFGITTIAAYSKAKRNPYLGWSYTYGTNRSIVGLITPATPTPPRRKEKKMLGLKINDGEGRYGGGTYFATYDGNAFVELGEADANAVSEHLDANFANVTYDAWAAYREAAATVHDLEA